MGSLARKFIDEVVGECDMTEPAKRAVVLLGTVVMFGLSYTRTRVIQCGCQFTIQFNCKGRSVIIFFSVPGTSTLYTCAY